MKNRDRDKGKGGEEQEETKFHNKTFPPKIP